MDNSYFKIKELVCSYNRKEANLKVVLQIDELCIPRGNIVFIVGQSGCGKSTILEILGLMNNTILSNENTVFEFSPSEEIVYDYLTIWEKSNKLISKIRLNYFSFIFQQTNLMKNFNIYENIAIAKMLQNSTEIESKRATNNILRSIGLEEFVIMNNGAWSKESRVFSKPQKISGGQQQRIAFARAMVSDFKILFCDEPTGNLDPKTADNLMNYLHDEVKQKEDATAVIVSHDLKLAVKYGDRIIKIFKQRDNNNEPYGLINSDSVFVKENKNWKTSRSTLSENEIIKKLGEESNETV
ncbi:MAG: ABC transporter ATP-binding protein [Bacteroidales bacterium]|jgi:ABC-type lipoprotein export system ATPase subunit|nr:ABC transporter ATP-binding protein [Bacteroidales bacterium]